MSLCLVSVTCGKKSLAIVDCSNLESDLSLPSYGHILCPAIKWKVSYQRNWALREVKCKIP